MTIKRDVLNVAAVIIGVSLAGYLLGLAINGNEALEETLELLAELFSIFISFSIFGVTWYAYGKSRDNHALFMGAAFLVIGFIDLFHTLSYPFMPDFITPNAPGKSAAFWNMARVISAPLLLASAYIYKDTLPAFINKPVLSVSAIVISIISFISGVFYHDYMPAAYHEDGISFLKVIQVLATAIIILYAGYLYTRRRTEKNIELLLMYGFIIVVFSDIIYFYHELSGHLLKVAGFYFIYISLYKSSVELPYEKLAIAEEKLRHAAEEKYRNLFDNANDAIVIHDPEGRVISWNNSAEKFFGWTAQEITGKKLVPIIIPPDRRAEIGKIIRTVVQRRLTGFEIEFLRKDGSRIQGSLTVSHLRDAGGNVTGVSGIIRDITERKRAEEALKKSKEFIETVINSMNDAISVIDVNDFRIIDVNTVFLDNYGLKKEDVIGKTCYEITHKRSEPCGLPDDICPLFGTLETGKHSTAEHVHYTVDGEKLYVEVSTSPIFDETGKVISVIHVARDITERKLSEDKLRESEERYRRLVEFSPYGIAIHSEGKLVYVNMAGAKILGTENPSLFIGKPLFEIIHPDYHEIVRERIRMEEEGKVAPLFEEKFMRFDGTPVDIEIVSIPFTYHGKLAMYGVFQDITERKRADEVIRASEEKFRSLIQSAVDGIVLADSSGKIISWNKGAENIFQYTEAEVLGNPISILMPERYREAHTKELVRVVTTGKSKYIGEILELYGLKRDGSEFPVELSVSMYKTTKGLFFGGIVHDITERKKAEEIRLQNEQLAYSNKLKSEFFSVMSHELRTPLNAIIGFSELLLQTAGKMDEKQVHFLNNINTGGKRLHSIIENILELTRAGVETMELSVEKIPVTQTINDVLNLIKDNAANHNVIIKTEFDPGLDFIEADSQKFKLVLFKLLDNAVKFSKKDGGTVIVTTKKEMEMAKFSVSDTGIGIKEEDMGKLFVSLQQIDMGTSRKYGGAGTGLAISKKHVELHGGKIWVKSRFGEGSTFTFMLPIKAKKKEEK